MKILVFLHGTIIMHKNAAGQTREEKVRQVKDGDTSVREYETYVPIGNAINKLRSWENQGAEIIYLSSHRSVEDTARDKAVLEKYDFPDGQVFFRQTNEQYKDVAEKIMPHILIEDDCESIGGIEEMTYSHIESELKNGIKHIVVKEFQGIDHLPDNISELKNF